MRESNIWKWLVYSRVILLCKNGRQRRKENSKFTKMKTRSISNLKIPRPLGSFETSVTTLRTTRRHISEDWRVLQYCCENLKYRNFKVYTRIRTFKAPVCTYKYIHIHTYVRIYVRYRNQVRITVRLRIMLLHFFWVYCRLPTADLTENTRRHSAMYDIVLPTELFKGCLCVEQQRSWSKTFPVACQLPQLLFF
jgi:hypothetical protein